MSFTDQKSREATEKHLSLSWGGRKAGEFFRCYLCGHKFNIGDIWRWVYSNKYCNFITCAKCDGPDVRDKWIAHNEEYLRLKHGKFWRFLTDEDQTNV